MKSCQMKDYSLDLNEMVAFLLAFFNQNFFFNTANQDNSIALTRGNSAVWELKLLGGVLEYEVYW